MKIIRVSPEEDKRPTIVCLCGSTRFWRTFQQAGLQETMAGKIVLSIGAASGTDDEHFGNLPREEYDRVKEMLDTLHFRKIEMADEVLILNVGGYIGQSTGNELAYAQRLGKRIRYWEDRAEWTPGAKPTGCTCQYPEVIARNMNGHAPDCPVYIEWHKRVCGE